MNPCRYPGIPCFWTEPLEVASVRLRRYHSDAAVRQAHEGPAERCPSDENPFGYHNAEGVEVARVELVWRDLGRGDKSWHVDFPAPPHDDPRWPTACACGYEFTEDDFWQVDPDRLYRRADTGEELRMAGPHGEGGVAPPGMLLDAHWYPCEPGPDGIKLMAALPNGLLWCVDGQATGGGGWTRTGDPRQPETLTCSPSIVAGDYHGFLQGGRFTDDLGS